MKPILIKTFIIVVLLSTTCSFVAFPQTLKPNIGSGKRPVLVDDIRIQTLYQTDVWEDWKHIPHLSNNQWKKIEGIEIKSKKKLAGIGRTLTKRTFQLETLYTNNPTNTKAIDKEEREIIKLENKLDNIILDFRKKIRRILNTEQISYLDSTN